MDLKELFGRFYEADTESEVYGVIQSISANNLVSWTPYGENENNFALVENQQASPVPALVEKITNSIDAILMRRCHEEGIDPKSPVAPESVNEAVRLFFENSRDWDLPGKRGIQAESIQILASGKTGKSSLVIYDDGEGQDPEYFSSTLLSLLRGNKNEIAFVQGKYNMGGAGAIVFCGKKRYQLVASKRFDKKGKFGFTIVRKHPLSMEEEKTRKNTWYEYLLIDGKIPAFDIDELDLGLYRRIFITGTIIKLYEYGLPAGSRSVISRDLNQSINEYLFEPALPLYTIDSKDRYPQDINLERHLYGLKKRIEQDDSKYIKHSFSISHEDNNVGSFKITVYIFNSRIDGKSVKETRATIKREFFKNNMSVLFSLNGQVHGNFTSEFISRTLKFNLLKDYLLIHVDCTYLKTNFRGELFMASRDRMKVGEETTQLRSLVADILKKGELKNIYKEWKDSITVQANSTDELLKNISKDLPMNENLMKLLGKSVFIDIKDNKKKKNNKKEQRKPKKAQKQEISFNPKRFPSVFNIDLKSKNEEKLSMTKIPLGGDKTLYFSTDVEDQYFDRIQDPGELKIAVLTHSTNNTESDVEPVDMTEPDELIDITKSSPSKGKIRVNIRPTDKVSVGDAIKIKASLTSSDSNLDEIFIVQISDKESTQKITQKQKSEEDKIGLPKLMLLYSEPKEGYQSWNDAPIDIDYQTIMHPLAEGDKLTAIYINMDSSVLKNYKRQFQSEEQLSVADKRYISSVYFHTLFLYMISKNKGYQIMKPNSDDASQSDDIDVEEYLKDLFAVSYSEFLLNFEINALMESLGD